MSGALERPEDYKQSTLSLMPFQQQQKLKTPRKVNLTSLRSVAEPRTRGLNAKLISPVKGLIQKQKQLTRVSPWTWLSDHWDSAENHLAWKVGVCPHKWVLSPTLFFQKWTLTNQLCPFCLNFSEKTKAVLWNRTECDVSPVKNTKVVEFQCPRLFSTTKHCSTTETEAKNGSDGFFIRLWNSAALRLSSSCQSLHFFGGDRFMRCVCEKCVGSLDARVWRTLMDAKQLTPLQIQAHLPYILKFQNTPEGFFLSWPQIQFLRKRALLCAHMLHTNQSRSCPLQHSHRHFSSDGLQPTSQAKYFFFDATKPKWRVNIAR